ncbi:SDR family NAD(P)-dependent oxidoreductase [Halioglobus maricola]|uniref:SDR family NAD(P)-dependent oxidoreductase n=1 Tax=Halioglobus maricola TaxID=2601894 RepID=A0A5P9NJT2_9GAMM|nr:SDR family NAD(P)-dependent oxidoreductase [Halioglobus maricola]QFU75785.1 SDR family NAD(P)-dependent oxidoreductase [Halioglobus maricola]
MNQTNDLVLITGGGSGMGREAARRFAAAGATVALFDVNQEGMAETAAGFDTVHAWSVDITDFEAVCAAAADVVEKHGPIGRLYNCAAIMPFGILTEQDNAIIHKQMAINYGGLVNITQAVLPGMLEQGRGDFVSFASMAGWIPMLKTGAYSATKFAVRAFTETLYHENINSGIRFACVCPPAVATPLLKQGKESDWPKMLDSQGEPLAPGDVIDAIEQSLDKGKFFVLPTRDSRIGVLMRRFLPGLIWKQVHDVEGF